MPPRQLAMAPDIVVDSGSPSPPPDDSDDDMYDAPPSRRADDFSPPVTRRRTRQTTAPISPGSTVNTEANTPTQPSKRRNKGIVKGKAPERQLRDLDLAEVESMVAGPSASALQPSAFSFEQGLSSRRSTTLLSDLIPRPERPILPPVLDDPSGHVGASVPAPPPAASRRSPTKTGPSAGPSSLAAQHSAASRAATAASASAGSFLTGLASAAPPSGLASTFLAPPPPPLPPASQPPSGSILGRFLAAPPPAHPPHSSATSAFAHQPPPASAHQSHTAAPPPQVAPPSLSTSLATAGSSIPLAQPFPAPPPLVSVAPPPLPQPSAILLPTALPAAGSQTAPAMFSESQVRDLLSAPAAQGLLHLPGTNAPAPVAYAPPQPFALPLAVGRSLPLSRSQ
ncbi:hypothetical protein C8R43DRAFT_1047895 [Mycena crocata]|nr:hypothetical protein C8R43DRAFT_1047895 [Mycena crocata]